MTKETNEQLSQWHENYREELISSAYSIQLFKKTDNERSTAKRTRWHRIEVFDAPISTDVIKSWYGPGEYRLTLYGPSRIDCTGNPNTDQVRDMSDTMKIE